MLQITKVRLLQNKKGVLSLPENIMILLQQSHFVWNECYRFSPVIFQYTLISLDILIIWLLMAAGFHHILSCLVTTQVMQNTSFYEISA